jgi:murein DD-endopeptidase MepM/ murein hydrolase activator NlpD
MALLNLVQAATTAYQQRDKLKKVFIGIVIFIASILFFVYLIVATVIAVIQGNGRISDNQLENQTPFTEFQEFSYKTINGEKWYAFVHPYIFPTLGALTQGVILDSSAKVGLKHIAWDIADRKSRDTEVKAFADGKVVSIKDNILHSTTRRWKFCDESQNGICWYEVKETADVQIGCGYEVIIEHPDSLRTQYCHLATEPALNIGDPVTMGQTMGYQGSTGYATGKHLHFALWRDGQPIDPSYAFSQTSLSDWEN